MNIATSSTITNILPTFADVAVNHNAIPIIDTIDILRTFSPVLILLKVTYIPLAFDMSKMTYSISLTCTWPLAALSKMTAIISALHLFMFNLVECFCIVVVFVAIGVSI